MAKLIQVLVAGALAQHLLHGIAGNDVRKKKNHGEDEPQRGEEQTGGAARCSGSFLTCSFLACLPLTCFPDSRFGSSLPFPRNSARRPDGRRGHGRVAE